MILERMNGRSLSKVVAEPDFCDVHYLRDMLMTVFTAVDAAQRAFGYVSCHVEALACSEMDFCEGLRSIYLMRRAETVRACVHVCVCLQACEPVSLHAFVPGAFLCGNRHVYVHLQSSVVSSTQVPPLRLAAG